MKDIRTPDDLIDFVKGISGIDTQCVQDSVAPQDGETSRSSDKVHTAAVSVFKALRILVNDELNQLDCGIKSSHYLLRDRAPLAAVSYNQLEDTIIKRHFTGIHNCNKC